MSRGTMPRAIRIPDDLWNAAQDKARRTGVTVSDKVRDGLQQWIDEDDESSPAGP